MDDSMEEMGRKIKAAKQWWKQAYGHVRTNQWAPWVPPGGEKDAARFLPPGARFDDGWHTESDWDAGDGSDDGGSTSKPVLDVCVNLLEGLWTARSVPPIDGTDVGAGLVVAGFRGGCVEFPLQSLCRTAAQDLAQRVERREDAATIGRPTSVNVGKPTFPLEFSVLNCKAKSPMNLRGSGRPPPASHDNSDKLYEVHHSADGRRLIMPAADKNLLCYERGAVGTAAPLATGDDDGVESAPGKYSTPTVEHRLLWRVRKEGYCLACNFLDNEKLVIACDVSDGLCFHRASDGRLIDDAALVEAARTMAGVTRTWTWVLAPDPVDGSRLLTASDECVACVFEWRTGTLLHKLSHECRVFSASWHPDGRTIVTGDSNSIASFYDVSGETVQGVLLHRIRVFDASSWVRRVAFSASGDLIAVGREGSVASQPCVAVVSATTGDLLWAPPVYGGQNDCRDVAFACNDEVLVCARTDSDSTGIASPVGLCVHRLPERVTSVLTRCVRVTVLPVEVTAFVASYAVNIRGAF